MGKKIEMVVLLFPLLIKVLHSHHNALFSFFLFLWLLFYTILKNILLLQSWPAIWWEKTRAAQGNPTTIHWLLRASQSRRAYSLVVSSVWLLKSLFIRRALEINVTKYVLWPQLKVLIINILLFLLFYYHSSSKCQNINKETCCDRCLLKSETFFRLSWFFSFFFYLKNLMFLWPVYMPQVGEVEETHSQYLVILKRWTNNLTQKRIEHYCPRG